MKDDEVSSIEPIEEYPLFISNFFSNVQKTNASRILRYSFFLLISIILFIYYI